MDDGCTISRGKQGLGLRKRRKLLGRRLNVGSGCSGNQSQSKTGLFLTPAGDFPAGDFPAGDFPAQAATPSTLLVCSAPSSNTTQQLLQASYDTTRKCA